MFRQHISSRPKEMPPTSMSLEQVEAQMRAGQFHQPQQWNRPTPPSFPQPQMRGMPYPQQRMMQQPPQPIHAVPPSPLIINGVRYSPVQISSTEKMAVFDIVQKIKPLFVHIDTLIRTLYEARGESEMARLQTLRQLVR
jgi:hypothetical protein